MKSKYISLLCAFTLAAVLGGCAASPSAPGSASGSVSSQEDPAQTQEAEALLAYQEILKAAPAIEGEHEELADPSFDYEQNLELFGNHYDLFMLSDLDQDGIPELIAQTTVNSRWTPVSVYTYADGSAVLLKDPLDPEAHGTFEQRSTANGAYYTYICDENHIHSVWRGTDPAGNIAEEDHAYVLEGTVLTEADCSVGENESATFFSDIAVANTAENADAITR